MLRVSAKDVTVWLQETSELVKKVAPDGVVVWVRNLLRSLYCRGPAEMRSLLTPLRLNHNYATAGTCHVMQERPI